MSLNPSLKAWLNGSDFPVGHFIVKKEWRDELLLGDLLENLSNGAAGISIEDADAHLTADNVEDALAELATDIDDVADDLATLITDLAAVTVSKGASMIGVQDSAGLVTATNVETVIAEIAARLNNQTTLSNVNAAAVPITYGGTVAFTTAGAETRTLAAPSRPGMVLTLLFQTDGGDCVITSANGINAAGNTSITLNDAGDILILVSFWNGSAYRWRVILNEGCTLA